MAQNELLLNCGGWFALLSGLLNLDLTIVWPQQLANTRQTARFGPNDRLLLAIIALLASSTT